MVDFLLYAANLDASVATRSKMSDVTKVSESCDVWINVDYR